MIPDKFTVQAINSRTYELRGHLHTHIRGRERVPCRIQCTDEECRVFVKLAPRRTLVGRLRSNNWHKVDVGDVRRPLDAVSRAEAILNGVTLPGLNGHSPETQKELPAGDAPEEQTALDFIWDGAMLREIADSVNWYHDRLERIVYVAGVATDTALIPTRFYEMDGDRSSVNVSVDAISKAKALDHMDRHGLQFLGSLHSHPPGSQKPSQLDINSMERFQSSFDCCGAVVATEEYRHLVRFYTVKRAIHVKVNDPLVKEVEHGIAFELPRA